MQLTNPPATADDVWNWQQNVVNGIIVFEGKLRMAAGEGYKGNELVRQAVELNNPGDPDYAEKVLVITADPLVATAQARARVTASTPFGLTITAETGDGARTRRSTET